MSAYLILSILLLLPTIALTLDAIAVNSGLVLFSEFQQFLLTTDSDILSAQTVKIKQPRKLRFQPPLSICEWHDYLQ